MAYISKEAVAESLAKVREASSVFGVYLAGPVVGPHAEALARALLLYQEGWGRLCRRPMTTYEAGRFDPNDPEVQIFSSPWVSGTRAAAYFGPITVERLVPHGDVTALDEVLQDLKDKAKKLGANAVVGREITLDPFDESGLVKVTIVGTAANLAPLF